VSISSCATSDRRIISKCLIAKQMEGIGHGVNSIALVNTDFNTNVTISGV
jgi:hypothetical protein